MNENGSLANSKSQSPKHRRSDFADRLDVQVGHAVNNALGSANSAIRCD